MSERDALLGQYLWLVFCGGTDVEIIAVARLFSVVLGRERQRMLDGERGWQTFGVRAG